MDRQDVVGVKGATRVMDGSAVDPVVKIEEEPREAKSVVAPALLKKLQAEALRSIVIGGHWSQARLAGAGYAEESCCRLCWFLLFGGRWSC